MAGPHASTDIRSLALQINQALGNVDRTVWFTRSPLVGAGDANRSMRQLVEALRAGQVRTLICAGGNPSYAKAGSYELGDLIRRVPQSVYLGLYENETARDCGWMVPAAHFLESWGDARAYDGTLSVVQPLVQPLSGARTTAELLSLLAGAGNTPAYDLLRDSWRRRGDAGRGDDFEEGWRSVLRTGVVEGSAFPHETSSPSFTSPAPQASTASGYELIFRPHPRVRDGAFANNGWLQELPDPVTTLTWENAAHISPATAQRLQVENGETIDVQVQGRKVRLPTLIVPGHADDAVTLHFGYGRQGAEALAAGVGANVYPLWPGDAFSAGGATVSAVRDGSRRELPITQPHHSIDDSSAARAVTLENFLNLRPGPRRRTLTLYTPKASLPDDAPAQQQWAMTIDLGACTGCGACVIACQAENNVPVVGPEQVRRGREMHWLRIDWYTSADAAAPASMPQPMLCQHCEKAPCEYVCPVEATVHSSDGLNEMVYNRCVGTRFCSNNCPYKVRRFNWFDFNAHLSERERLGKNPDVTVRERGVMEKCTFCVQRIREADIAARAAHRPLIGSDVRTACQQACPTQAIVFGSLTDSGGAVSRDRSSPRAYAVLEDLGTEPRVTYLARVRNPNPDLERQS
jgi:molybdopterin-containing oxidoreductase family iron-sulfur binding subunit